MKRVLMVLMMACMMVAVILSPVLVSGYTNLETMGTLEDRKVIDGFRTVVILQGVDGKLPKDEYIAMRSVFVETLLQVEAGTIIHFNYSNRVITKFLFIISSLTFEPNCTLDAINITDSATPVWGGIRVEESGSFEADGLALNNVEGDWIMSLGNLSLKNMSVRKVLHYGDGRFFAQNVELTDVLVAGPSQVLIQNSTFNIGAWNINTERVHIVFGGLSGFNGRAMLYTGNKWMGNGGNPLIGLGSNRIADITSDPKKLEEHNILIQPPTAVLQNSWGEIKKLFQKH